MTKKDKTKQNLLAAGLIEFGENGFKLASTNNIYKLANTSKGTIFSYYKSKADLYYEVFKFYLEQFVEKVNQIDLDMYDDVIEKIIHMSLWKYQYFKTHKYEYNIFTEALSNPPKVIKDKIYSNLDMLTKLSLKNFFDDIDMSNISSEYTKEDVISYISLAVEGLKNEILKGTITLEDFNKDKDRSIKFIKIILKGMEK